MNLWRAETVWNSVELFLKDSGSDPQDGPDAPEFDLVFALAHEKGDVEEERAWDLRVWRLEWPELLILWMRQNLAALHTFGPSDCEGR